MKKEVLGSMVLRQFSSYSSAFIYSVPINMYKNIAQPDMGRPFLSQYVTHLPFIWRLI